MQKTVDKVKTINEFRHQPASGICQLDEYIRAHERTFGRIRVRCTDLSRQAKLSESLKQLKEVLCREKRHRIEAYEHLRDTNKTMKKTISDLHHGFESSRASILKELKKIESANTYRLLHINPNLLYKRSKALG